MDWIINKNVLIVGLGLIGGSYAMGLKRMGFTVTAIDTNEDSINYATEQGIIDKGVTFADETIISEADAIIFGLYPNIFVKWIEENQKFFKPGVMITDVTGVKEAIVYKIQDMLRDDVEFIAAHPMAGREVSGVRNSDDIIFRGANYIVVPTEKNTEAAIEWCKRLGKMLGFANIAVLSPQEHDKMIGYVSQLTHCIAVSLMNCNNFNNVEQYTGDSFRDLTRIARINENMWSELFFMNKDTLIDEMDNFIKEMTEIKTLMETDNAEGLKQKMRQSTERRIKFDKKKK